MLKNLLSDITPPTSMSQSDNEFDYFPVLMVVLAIVSVVMVILCLIYLIKKQKKENTYMANPSTKEVICPHCGSKEIVFVAEHDKSIIARILFMIMLIFECYISIRLFSALSQKRSDGTEVIFALLAVGIIISFITMTINESATHIRVICKNCGQTGRIQ